MGYLVINRSPSQGQPWGVVVSTHRTRANAENASSRLIRAVKARCGETSYLDMVVVEVSDGANVGDKHDT